MYSIWPLKRAVTRHSSIKVCKRVGLVDIQTSLCCLSDCASRRVAFFAVPTSTCICVSLFPSFIPNHSGHLLCRCPTWRRVLAGVWLVIINNFGFPDMSTPAQDGQTSVKKLKGQSA